MITTDTKEFQPYSAEIFKQIETARLNSPNGVGFYRADNFGQLYVVSFTETLKPEANGIASYAGLIAITLQDFTTDRTAIHFEQEADGSNWLTHLEVSDRYPKTPDEFLTTLRKTDFLSPFDIKHQMRRRKIEQAIKEQEAFFGAIDQILESGANDQIYNGEHVSYAYCSSENDELEISEINDGENTGQIEVIHRSFINAQLVEKVYRSVKVGEERYLRLISHVIGDNFVVPYIGVGEAGIPKQKDIKRIQDLIFEEINRKEIFPN